MTQIMTQPMNIDNNINKIYLSNEMYYIGNSKDDKPDGYGTLYCRNRKYVGYFKSSFIQGFATTYISNKKAFEGYFIKNQENGEGTTYYYKTTGNVDFKGNFINSKKSGFGTKFDENGNKIYEGNWHKDFKHGKGKLYEGNKIYEGEWKQDLKHGEFILYENGKIKFKGMFKKDNLDGHVIEYHNNGNIKFDGYYKENKKIYGKEFDKLSEIIYNGSFDSENKYHGIGTVYENGTNKTYNWSHGIKEPEYDEEPPEEFLCPITYTLINEPVQTLLGNVYDRVNIMKWFNNNNNTDPITNVKLNSTELIPNYYLRDNINKWKEQHKIET